MFLITISIPNKTYKYLIPIPLNLVVLDPSPPKLIWYRMWTSHPFDGYHHIQIGNYTSLSTLCAFSIICELIF